MNILESRFNLLIIIAAIGYVIYRKREIGFIINLLNERW